MSKRFKVLLCGAFGYGNMGDNLLRDEAIKFFNEYFPEIDVYVDRPYPNKELIDYVDLRIIGPGGVLYDTDIIHTEYFKQYCKPPFICLGVGIQWPEHIIKDGLVETCFKNADLIFDRHESDKPYIKQARKNLKNVYITPDFGYYFEPTLNTHLYEKRNKSRKVVGLCICEDARDLLPKEILPYIDIFISISKHDNQITEELSRVKNENKTTNDYYFDSYQIIKSILNNLDLLITSRFHAGILATSNQRTKIVSLINEKDGRWYKFLNEFPERLDSTKLLCDKNNYIKSIPLKTTCCCNGTELTSIKEEQLKMVDILIDYFKANFNLKS